MDQAYAAVTARPRVARYFQRVLGGFAGSRIEVLVWNHEGDPDQLLGHMDRDGILREWDKRVESGWLVFRSPDNWNGEPMCWRYDRGRQVTERILRQEAERLATRFSVTA